MRYREMLQGTLQKYGFESEWRIRVFLVFYNTKQTIFIDFKSSIQQI